MDLAFEWDPHKDQANLEKHRISFSEATSVASGSSVLGAQREGNSTIMKSTSKSKGKTKVSRTDELQPEYRFDYANAKPNRFADRVRPGSVAILLDPDVARVFQNAESVNGVLRALLSTMPTPRGRGTG